MEPHSLKLTIKLKSEKSVNNSLTTTDLPSNLGGEPHTSNSYRLGSLTTNSQDPVGFNSARGLGNHSRQDRENPSENSQKELVLHDPSANGSGEATPDPISDRPLSSQRQHPRALPSVGAFTVQCADCFKWRLIPTQEKYEEIRECIIEQPFVCGVGREWRPDISCDDPPDLEQDGSRLWAIDKPSIARPPTGWQRLLKFRGEGSSKFADVYYVAPSGKRLRSMVEVQRYSPSVVSIALLVCIPGVMDIFVPISLYDFVMHQMTRYFEEHPDYKEQGISLSQFSFQIPRPLQENYVRKRPRAAPTSDADDLGMLRLPHPAEVEPISWVRPDVDTDLELCRPGLSTDYSKSPNLKSETQSAEKRKTPPKRKANDDLFHSPINFNTEEADRH